MAWRNGTDQVASEGRRFALTRRRAVVATMASIGVIGAVVAAATAYADPAPAPRFVAGNVATCEAAGLTGSILFGAPAPYLPNPAAGFGTVSGDGITLDVTINLGYTASGIVVKGGPDTNVYDGPFVGPITITGMVSPTLDNGQVPEISHWFVCGGTSPPTPSSPPVTTPPATSEPPPTSGPPPTSTDPGTSSSSTPPGDDDLPRTGAAIGGLVLTGLVLVVGGVALILARRRRDTAGPVDEV